MIIISNFIHQNRLHTASPSDCQKEAKEVSKLRDCSGVTVFALPVGFYVWNVPSVETRE